MGDGRERDISESKFATLPNDGKSIRILTIKPSLYPKGPLIGDLQVAQIGSGINYEALSYCWGSSECTEYLQIEGRHFPLARNLASALRALRLPNESRTIWVDAVCIDQADNEEKGFQVALMRQIYANCSKTIVWLGESDSYSRKVFHCIRTHPGKYPRDLAAVLRKPWFRRVWVVQEIAFPPHVVVQCGSESVGWEGLAQAGTNVSQLGSTVNPSTAPGTKQLHPSFYLRMMETCRRRIQSGQRYNILEALRSFRPFDATIAVDKIYGLLGLLDGEVSVTVDYRRPPEAVYRDVALSSINQSHRLEVFMDCFQRASGPPFPGLNSWVPHWLAFDRMLQDAVDTVSPKEGFNTTRGSQLKDAHLVNNEWLLLQGHLICRIAEVGRAIPTGADIRERYWPGRLPTKRFLDIVDEAMEIYHDWTGVACRTRCETRCLSDLYPTNETVFEAFLSTVVLRGPPPSDIKEARNYERWLFSVGYIWKAFLWYSAHIAKKVPWILIWIVTGPLCVLLSFDLLLKAFRGQIVFEFEFQSSDTSQQSWVPGRTDNGLFGVFPAPGLITSDVVAAMPGDAIFLLQGGATPYVLRKHGQGWRLIGDAYIHGIMHGAAYKQEKCEPVYLI